MFIAEPPFPKLKAPLGAKRVAVGRVISLLKELREFRRGPVL